MRVSAERDGEQNVREAVIGAKIFLGECLEFQLKVGDTMLLARVHPSFTPPVGTRVYLRIDPDKCIAIPDEARRHGA